jgi:hypothetical protein
LDLISAVDPRSNDRERPIPLGLAIFVKETPDFLEIEPAVLFLALGPLAEKPLVFILITKIGLI